MKKKYISILSVMILTLSYFFSSTAIDAEASNISSLLCRNDLVESHLYTIRFPYTYKILPETEEWYSYTTAIEKRAACYVPLSIGQQMTTRALMETVLTYPLLIDFLAFPDIKTGIEIVSGRFPCLSEFLSREFAELYLIDFLSLKVFPSDDVVSILAGQLLNYLGESVTDLQNQSLPIDRQGPCTPLGTPVEYIDNMTWSDHGMTREQALAIDYAYQYVYPNAIELAGIDPSYNCHSYAWHSQSTANRYWINDPSEYVEDGSYRLRTSVASGYKVTYSGFSVITHSAIAISVGYTEDENTLLVNSKWGMYGLYQHYVMDCPFYDNLDIKYYSLNQ